jgi:hypothetical protein
LIIYFEKQRRNGILMFAAEGCRKSTQSELQFMAATC